LERIARVTGEDRATSAANASARATLARTPAALICASDRRCPVRVIRFGVALLGFRECRLASGSRFLRLLTVHPALVV